MPQFHSAAAARAGTDLDQFTRAYIEAAYFTDTGEPDQPSGDAQLSPEGVARAVEDCAQFQQGAARVLTQAYQREGYDSVCAGHDFWLTRNGHGVGFWDRRELEGEGIANLGERLTKMAERVGPCDLYAGDDGALYFT